MENNCKYTPIISTSANDNDGDLAHAIDPSDIENIDKLYKNMGNGRFALF